VAWFVMSSHTAAIADYADQVLADVRPDWSGRRPPQPKAKEQRE
jgi:hypothetical protein